MHAGPLPILSPLFRPRAEMHESQRKAAIGLRLRARQGGKKIARVRPQPRIVSVSRPHPEGKATSMAHRSATGKKIAFGATFGLAMGARLSLALDRAALGAGPSHSHRSILRRSNPRRPEPTDPSLGSSEQDRTKAHTFVDGPSCCPRPEPRSLVIPLTCCP